MDLDGYGQQRYRTLPSPCVEGGSYPWISIMASVIWTSG